MKGWVIAYDRFDPKEEGVRETLCTLGNGYFALRGAAIESRADEMHYPGTYLAGGYNRLTTKISNEIIENEDLVNFPNCLMLNIKIENGSWFHIKDVEILEYSQVLNMQEGVLSRRVHFRDEEGRETLLCDKRFVSMADSHAVAIELIVYALNWDGVIHIQSGLDGRIENAGVERYMKLERTHLECVEMGYWDPEIIYLQVRTNQSHIHMALAARTRIFMNGVEKGEYTEKNYVANIYKLYLCRNQPLVVEKIISLHTSKDKALSECGLEACHSAERLGSFDQLLKEHKTAWIHIWRRFDIQIDYHDDEEDLAKLLRLHLFHLLQTTSTHTKDIDCGVPPRGWHGEAYRGHILWDELFIFPTLNLQFPEITRGLLLYRYRRLPAAKRAAFEAGFKGAMYPWQSGSDGREESQSIHLNPLSGRWIPDNSHLQRHVNSAIAYNVWQHFEATGDLEFLSFYGAEMLFEIARFWASHATYNHRKERYEILGVMGPDEFHDGYPHAEKPGLNNNAYTNVMASWVLKRALEARDALPKDRVNELEECLQLDEEEFQHWEKLSNKMYIPFHEGMISQFEGYEELQELDWVVYQKKYGNIQRMDRILEAEGEHVNAYKVSKQADVLMLFYLFSAEELRTLFEQLGYSLQKEAIRKTIKYYMARTSHGSSLSEVIHSWILSRSARDASWNLFRNALKGDFIDAQGGTTAEGIHLGAMASTVDLIQRCYSGLEFRGSTLRFHPSLPRELRAMRTTIRYRGHSLIITITHKKIRITSERASAKPIQIAFEDIIYSLEEGETIELKPQINPKQ